MAKSNHDKMADAIVALVYKVLRRSDAPVAKVRAATWTNVNAGSSELSDITLVHGAQVIKGVPHFSSTAIGGFAAGDPILVITGPGTSYVILGKIVGDITLAV